MAQNILVVKMVGRLNISELMERLGLKEKDSVVENVRQGSLRRFGRVLRKDDGEYEKQAWNFELDGDRGRGSPKLDWKTMEKKCCKVGVKLLDAKDRAKLRCCVES